MFACLLLVAGAAAVGYVGFIWNAPFGFLLMSVFALVWSLMFFSGFLLNTAGSFVGPRYALAGGATIVLAYVWLSLVRATALKHIVLAPKPG